MHWRESYKAKVESARRQHKIHPRIRTPAKRLHHRRALLLRDSIRLKYPAHLRHLFFGNFFDLAIFSLALLLVMLSITACRQIAAKSHRDRTSGDLGETSHNNQPRILHRAGKPRRQSKWNRESI